jgi:hypothetical protein
MKTWFYYFHQSWSSELNDKTLSGYSIAYSRVWQKKENCWIFMTLDTQEKINAVLQLWVNAICISEQEENTRRHYQWII